MLVLNMIPCRITQHEVFLRFRSTPGVRGRPCSATFTLGSPQRDPKTTPFKSP